MDLCSSKDPMDLCSSKDNMDSCSVKDPIDSCSVKDSIDLSAVKDPTDSCSEKDPMDLCSTKDAMDLCSVKDSNISPNKRIQKYTLVEKQKLARLALRYKEEYNSKLEAASKLPKVWNKRRKAFVCQSPSDVGKGYLARAVRETFPYLKDVKHDDPQLKNVVKIAARALESLEGKLERGEIRSVEAAEEEANGPTASKRKCREPGGGRKSKAPEVRQALFEWYLNIRGSLKGKLPVTIFRNKAISLHQEWLKQQEIEVQESDQLKFSRRWIHGWMKEYNVSLLTPNKRFQTKQMNRVTNPPKSLEELLKTITSSRGASDKNDGDHGLLDYDDDDDYDYQSTSNAGDIPCNSRDGKFNADAKLINEVSSAIKKYMDQTSTLFIPFVCQLQGTVAIAKRSLKRRLNKLQSGAQTQPGKKPSFYQVPPTESQPMSTQEEILNECVNPGPVMPQKMPLSYQVPMEPLPTSGQETSGNPLHQWSRSMPEKMPTPYQHPLEPLPSSVQDPTGNALQLWSRSMNSDMSFARSKNAPALNRCLIEFGLQQVEQGPI